MENDLILQITNDMRDSLTNYQIDKLKQSLIINFEKYEINIRTDEMRLVEENEINHRLINSFISSKKVEGCSERTTKYYEETIIKFIDDSNKFIKNIDTDDIRNYLSQYKEESNCGSTTIDNIRRILSSFFSWLEDEDYIVKSPVRRIHKVKTAQLVKDTLSDENIEHLRDNCENIRDLSLIELFISTGMRVGELVRLNRDDIDYQNRECIVTGKGDKQRKVYFDARTKIHLQKYVNSRTDTNDALFVSLLAPNNRLEISGVEIRLRRLGRELNIPKVHPHKFRRTLATMAIDKGMPIEQVQHLLGHQSLDTTLQYAMVNQNNVKLSHHKFIG